MALPADPGLRIEAPRQLRLSALLCELRADAERRAQRRARDAGLTPSFAPPTHATPQAARTIAAPSPPVVVDSSDGLSVGEILDATAHAGFGFVAAFLALVAIPFVGVSLPFGLAVAFVGAQIVAGKERPWLPQRIRRRQISLAALDTITRWLMRMTRWMTHLVRARWTRLTSEAGFRAIGMGLVILGLGLALPVPIPGSNMIFLVPILIYSIGVLDDDGVMVAIGHLATLANIACIVALWRGVAAAIAHGVSWFGL